MSRTSTPQASRLRSDLKDLTELAERDLSVVWRRLDSPGAAKQALNDILPSLILVYGTAASALAANWYDDLRVEMGAKRRFSAVVPDLPASLGADALAGYAVGPLYRAEPDWNAARTLAEGGMQRRIANMSRQTITGSSIADPSAGGWQRVGAGNCTSGFCDMLIGRGAVYSEATADFAAHDHCKCSAQPAFGGQPKPVKAYTPSDRNITDADRARLRAYLEREKPSTATKGATNVPKNIDAARSVEQLRTTLADLEKSALKFESPGTRARIEQLRREIDTR